MSRTNPKRISPADMFRRRLLFRKERIVFRFDDPDHFPKTNGHGVNASNRRSIHLLSGQQEGDWLAAHAAPWYWILWTPRSDSGVQRQQDHAVGYQLGCILAIDCYLNESVADLVSFENALCLPHPAMKDPAHKDWLCRSRL